MHIPQKEFSIFVSFLQQGIPSKLAAGENLLRNRRQRRRSAEVKLFKSEGLWLSSQCFVHHFPGENKLQVCRKLCWIARV